MSVLPGSVRLDPHELDHLSPLLGFVGNEMAEVDGRACKRDAPNVCDARLQFGIDKADIDLLIELVDDLGGCVLGNADAIPLAEQELGWIEGHNYQFEYRWPDNNPELE